MKISVHNEKELAQAIEKSSDTIEIHGDLAKQTIRIKAAGNVAWAIAFGAIAVAMASVFLTVGSGGTSAPVTAGTMFLTAPVAATTLGLGAAVTVGSLVVAAGSIGAAKLLLGKLRNGYVIKEKKKDSIILQKK
ncbi:hypothetical protein D3C78_124100 [compost metagenome]|jgi:hypothetical protein